MPCGVLASALAFVTGLFLLLMQVPRRPANSSLRISGSDDTLLATLSPDVLSRALSERAQGVPGVERCTVFVTGSPSKLWVQADTSVAPDCEVEWTVTELRKQLSEDVATSLGTPPKQLDVLVRLARSVSSTSTSRPSQASSRQQSLEQTHEAWGRADEALPHAYVYHAATFTRPGLSLSSQFAQSADHLAPMRRFSRLFTEVA